MNFNARMVPKEKEKEKGKDQSNESTYVTSIITTRRLPKNATCKEKGPKEQGTDFQEMVKCLGKGIKAHRPTWKEGEFLWKEGSILVHNTPYFGGEMINQYINGYPYVAEEGDISANDWVILKEEESTIFT